MIAPDVIVDLIGPRSERRYEAAMRFPNFEYEDALQFVTCRRVAAKYLVTSADYGVQQMPVRSRTAGEVVEWWGRG